MILQNKKSFIFENISSRILGSEGQKFKKSQHYELHSFLFHKKMDSAHLISTLMGLNGVFLEAASSN